MNRAEFFNRLIERVTTGCSDLEGRYHQLPSGQDARNYCEFYRRDKRRDLFYSVSFRPNVLDAEVFVKTPGEQGRACYEALLRHAEPLRLGLPVVGEQAGDMGWRIAIRVDRKATSGSEEACLIWFTLMVQLLHLHFRPILDNYSMPTP